MPAEDMTIGEIGRAVQRVETRLDQMAEQMVPASVYALQHRTMQDEMAELKAALAEERKLRLDEAERLRAEQKAESARRVADRKWWITAILIPVASLVLTYAVPLLGGGGVA